MHCDFCRVSAQKVVDGDSVEYVPIRGMDVQVDMGNIAQSFQVFGELLRGNTLAADLLVNADICTTADCLDREPAFHTHAPSVC